MINSAENISSALNSVAQSKTTAVIATTTGAAVVVTSKDPAILGNYLATHGIYLLSWIEIFQIIGSIYVSYQLLKVAHGGALKLFNLIRGYKNAKLRRQQTKKNTIIPRSRKPKSA